MFLEVPAVEQAYLGEEHRRHEGHLSQLLQAALHLKLVPLLLHHEGHDVTIGTALYRTAHTLSLTFTSQHTTHV